MGELIRIRDSLYVPQNINFVKNRGRFGIMANTHFEGSVPLCTVDRRRIGFANLLSQKSQIVIQALQ
ncbi:uncharacterized protein N7500_006113 [Penicillium coprophilum]|uniref:uncharacterized protein n=1 Tax=Penicillium coprophilum TaxID=36646 RepID=UPI002389542A|nr:uncharacterized protein N7500_006113 [Penicillium coprophilum]KAJ5164283.1 hypothetical protein N7500_006113 [Penicillium coprophilum]